MADIVESVVMPVWPHVHAGSGPYPDMHWRVVNPSSVPGSVKVLLTETTIVASVYCYFFKTKDPSILPSHFAAAVSPDVKDFSNVNVFFHPNPGAADPPLQDSDYPFGGTWPNLFRYAPYLGTQLSGAKKDQVLIMPFIPGALFDTTGDLVSEWRPIFTDIVRKIKEDVTGINEENLELFNMAVSSYSGGIKASDAFRTHAKKIKDVMSEIWDLDGMTSQYNALSKSLHSSKTVRVTQYQQSKPTLGNSFLVSPPRWFGMEPKMKTLSAKEQMKAAHRGVAKLLFYHCATLSKIG